jgi:hypothetical protein
MSSCGPAEKFTLGSGFVVWFLVPAWLFAVCAECDRPEVATHRRLNTIFADGRSVGTHRGARLAPDLLVADVTHAWLLAWPKAEDIRLYGSRRRTFPRGPDPSHPSPPSPSGATPTSFAKPPAARGSRSYDRERAPRGAGFTNLVPSGPTRLRRNDESFFCPAVRCCVAPFGERHQAVVDHDDRQLVRRRDGGQGPGWPPRRRRPGRSRREPAGRPRESRLDAVWSASSAPPSRCARVVARDTEDIAAGSRGVALRVNSQAHYPAGRC